jgi:hypothetical protein
MREVDRGRDGQARALGGSSRGWDGADEVRMAVCGGRVAADRTILEDVEGAAATDALGDGDAMASGWSAPLWKGVVRGAAPADRPRSRRKNRRAAVSKVQRALRERPAYLSVGLPGPHG